jgi:hypothetical protein
MIAILGPLRCGAAAARQNAAASPAWALDVWVAAR